MFAPNITIVKTGWTRGTGNLSYCQYKMSVYLFNTIHMYKVINIEPSNTNLIMSISFKYTLVSCVISSSTSRYRPFHHPTITQHNVHINTLF